MCKKIIILFFIMLTYVNMNMKKNNKVIVQDHA